VKFIKPKNTNADKVDWLISERTKAIVKYYAEYTEYTESEIVDKFLKNILDDKDFIKWIEQKRNNKRLIKQMEIEDLVKVKSIG
jgi:DNA relaxase NicK